uniref:glycerol kinase n=1 Tax=Chromera velia CCMP2878 TaxID=1169474 RepID=A0A0G4HCM2_9ALVE|eukprot:Cvel_26154.t1-p1 / transcript=Cvel_26154.t1 / gene=Cvel_26154 / organism=Chromera_velia_CCMP2878 / gene_product=Glycerol kinase, putative / transcript_product=Glycerol kinase, putative / location=Cvel_scaffold3068:8240-11560(+) / protein_length=599 / sequence_SO=supercontig / SO=protein_coding / is_pseudo=false
MLTALQSVCSRSFGFRLVGCCLFALASTSPSSSFSLRGFQYPLLRQRRQTLPVFSSRLSASPYTSLVDMPRDIIASIDQGTQSSRVILFDKKTRIVTARHQEHKQIHPQSGWVEHDPMEILGNVRRLLHDSVIHYKHMREKSPSLTLLRQNSKASTEATGIELHAIGIANQRETVVAWDKTTGKPLHNAIVWLDTRTQSLVDDFKQNSAKGAGLVEFLREKTGLPLATYFSALKMKWLIDNCAEVKKAVEEGRCCLGTIDTWLLWNLTGGVEGGAFVTDVTNASRTLLMNLKTCQWDEELLQLFGIPRQCLAEIRSNSEVYGTVKGTNSPLLEGTPVSGCAGDQQAACLGQLLFEEGQVKCTYGTGAFILMNTGEKATPSTHGLLTTPCYKLGKEAPVIYALEGSIAIAGAAVSWLKHNLGLLSHAAETEALLESVEDSEGVVFVPAFSGLYAPRWRPDARGTILGLSQKTQRAHIVRALFEGLGCQLREVVEAMRSDTGLKELVSVRADGGMSVNSPFLQLTADILQLPVERPVTSEVTSLGAAFAAGLAVGFWKDLEEVRDAVVGEEIFEPSKDAEWVSERVGLWDEGVKRSLGWSV